MTYPSDEQLRENLPHSLLKSAAARRVPLDRRLVSFEQTMMSFAGEPFWDTLCILSQFGEDAAASVDFFASGVLPPPEHDDFPIMALGLSVLLDAAPGALLKGINARWGSYFRIFSIKLMRQFIDLPDRLKPWSRQRWEDDLGLTTEQWIWATNVMLTPCVHSEIQQLHEYNWECFSQVSVVIPDLYPHIIDPYTEKLKGDFGKSIYSFSGEVKRGIPSTENLGYAPTFADAMYWYKMIDRVHLPVVQHFGRYPYRNPAMGRVSTEEEIQFQEDVHHFGEIDAESAREIRKDVERGVWRPIQK